MAAEVPGEVIEKLRKDIRAEMSKKVAGWAIAGGAGVAALAALGAWTVLKPRIAAQLEVVPRSELKTLIPTHDQIKELVNAELESQVLAVEIPEGVVVAFDGGAYEKTSSNRLNSGCPEGWVRFVQADGRFILGSDAYPSAGEDGTYALRVEGGEESVRLTDAKQIPSHTHSASIASGNNVLQAKNFSGDTATVNIHGSDRSIEFSRQDISVSVSNVGGDMPHNNMPPYVALYYCKKG